ncbi:MAG TPA: hypothetical protein VFR09_04400 [Alphaproteobacteria bacterium]|nr:hypothetical protein [Alphaproteobacteria bacterium]
MNAARLPEWCLRIGICYLIAGMSFGAYMGATDNFGYRDVHAHLNLLGYVSTFLIGLFLKAYPSALKSKATVISVWCVIAAVALMLVLLTIFQCGVEAVAQPLGIASFLTLLAYVAFAGSVFWVTKK